jgi:predicted dinucleotide-utilizing enzyme
MFGLSMDSQAWTGTTKYNDARVVNAVNAVLSYLEGTFGALIMAAAGIGAIISASFGGYKAAISLMVVAVGAFILRSLMSTFFNDSQVQDF